MPAVGFEPGTFRSCVAHSIHYATETPPLPDVLLVLVAPKHINRNGTTTLQSRFTPTPTPRVTPHSSPKFGLYRFFNSFLQNPYLLTWRIWGKIFGLYRFFNIFLQNSYLLTWRIWGIVKTPSILLVCQRLREQCLRSEITSVSRVANVLTNGYSCVLSPVTWT